MDSIAGKMPLSDCRSSFGFPASLHDGKPLRAVKSECDSLHVDHTVGGGTCCPVEASVCPVKLEPCESTSTAEQTQMLAGCENDVLDGLKVKQEPRSPTAEPAGHMSPMHNDTVSIADRRAVAADTVSPSSSLCAIVTDSDLTDMNCKDADSPAAAACVNMSSSESPLCSSVTSFELPLCFSELSVSVSSAVSSAMSSSRQELIKCHDSFNKTCLLRKIQSPSLSSLTVKSESLRVCCALSPSHSATVASPLNSLSTDESVCNMTVESVKSNGACSSVHPTLVTTSSSHSITASAVTLTTVTLSSSVPSTLASSCSSHTAASVPQLHQVYLLSGKHRDRTQVKSVLNSAVIKPRPFVPLSVVKSPARSLPHITVLPSISPAVMSSQSTTSVSNGVSTQRPAPLVTARLPMSSSSPVYFVIETNNKVVSGNSRLMKEVTVGQGTNNTVMKAVSSVPTSASAVVRRCSSSAGLPQCVTTVKVCDGVGTTALRRISKPAQMSRFCSQVSVLRPQNTTLSTVVTKPSSVELQTQVKRSSSSSSVNVFATKIGNQTVIVDMGSLSSASPAAVKPPVTTPAFASCVKTEDKLVSRPVCSQQDSTSTPCLNSSSAAVTEDMSENFTPVIRYFKLFKVLF